MQPVSYSQTIFRCESYSLTYNNSIESLNYLINESTSVETFENLLEEMTTLDRDISQIGLFWLRGSSLTLLGIAASKGNSEIVHYLLKKNKYWFERGNQWGWTPLFCTAYLCADTKKALLVAKELILLGADPNLATCLPSKKNFGSIPAGATPIWAAAEKTHNISLINYLIKNGAKTHGIRFSKQGKRNLKMAKWQLINRRLFLAAYFKAENKESIVQKLPLEMITLIFRFTHDA